MMWVYIGCDTLCGAWPGLQFSLLAATKSECENNSGPVEVERESRRVISHLVYSDGTSDYLW